MPQIRITYRPFSPGDLPGILKIQNDNLSTALTPAQQTDGFLSVGFTPQQFIDMHKQIPIVVADLNPDIGGYLCGTTLANSRRVPLLAHMMTLFPRTRYRNKPLDAYRSYIYGPVCIHRPLRGTGLLTGLFNTHRKQLAGRYTLGALFISKQNPRSLKAHTRLGMTVVEEFAFENKEFYLLAFEVW